VASCARFTQGDHLRDSEPSRAFVETGRLLIYGFPAPVKGEKDQSARLRLMLPQIVELKRMTVDGFVFHVERLFMNLETPYVDLYRERRGRLELITFTYSPRVMSRTTE